MNNDTDQPTEPNHMQTMKKFYANRWFRFLVFDGRVKPKIVKETGAFIQTSHYDANGNCIGRSETITLLEELFGFACGIGVGAALLLLIPALAILASPHLFTLLETISVATSAPHP
jgi:hypothetical protein